MSIKLMTKVFESKVESSRKLLLLALADYANDDGVSIYPAVSTMASKTSFTERTIYRLLDTLKTDGILAGAGVSKYGTIDYCIHPEILEKYTPDTESPPDRESSPPLTQSQYPPDTESPDPSVNHHNKPPFDKEAFKQRITEAVTGGQEKQDGLIRALETLTGLTLSRPTKTEQGYLKDLREWSATPAQCAHFEHYLQVSEKWRTSKPDLKTVWQKWKDVIGWNPQPVPASNNSWGKKWDAMGNEIVNGS